jgi:hypothetical protein
LAITAATVVFPAKRTAVISWAVPVNATSYRVRVSKKNSTRKWNAWKSVTTASVRLKKLTRKGTYRVQITPIGPGGVGATTTWKFKQTK